MVITPQDPRLGFARQKALRARVQSMQQQNPMNMSHFARDGYGRRPRSVIGGPMAGGEPIFNQPGARAGALDFLRPQNAQSAGIFQSGGPGSNYRPTPPMQPPALPGSPNPAGPVGVGPGGSSNLPGVGAPPPSGPVGVDPNGGSALPGVGAAPASGPQLIPVGPGIWYDPATGLLQGLGGPAAPTAQGSGPIHPGFAGF